MQYSYLVQLAQASPSGQAHGGGANYCSYKMRACGIPQSTDFMISMHMKCTGPHHRLRRNRAAHCSRLLEMLHFHLDIMHFLNNGLHFLLYIQSILGLSRYKPRNANSLRPGSRS